jgi:hypothetical protein
MIGQVLRLSTIIANMMAASSLALAITIAAAGTIERSGGGCTGCLHAAGAFGVRPAGIKIWQPSSLQLAAAHQ